MKKTTQQIARQIARQLTADPKRLIHEYKEAYPGIADDEAQVLAIAFTGLLCSGAELETKQREYAKTLAEMERKYPGGAFPSIDLPAFDFDIPLWEDDAGQ